MKPAVLLGHPMLAPLEAMLSAEHVVRRLWEWPDGLPPAGEADVRAIVAAGEARLTPALLSALPQLGLIACVSVGYDGIDVPWCREHGIAVTHAEGLNADDVADHALGLLIGLARGIVDGDRRVRDGRWAAGDRLQARASLKGRRVGIVGLGAIGEALARRVEALGMSVAWWGPRPKPEAGWPRADSLLALARDSDVLVVCARAHAGNAGLVDAEVIAALGQYGLLINVARGSLVDEDALIAALKEGRIGGAGLDVYAQEPTPPERWEGVPDTVLTPHTAGGTRESLPVMIGQMHENLRRFFAGEPLLSPVLADD